MQGYVRSQRAWLKTQSHAVVTGTHGMQLGATRQVDWLARQVIPQVACP